MYQSNVDLDDLVDRSVMGDGRALAQLLARIYPAIVRYCRARISPSYQSVSSADDIAQEVCLALLTALPTYVPQGRPFLAFAYRIAAHKVTDAHRAAARAWAMPMAQVPDQISDDVDPQHRIVQGAVARAVADLLATLPAQQREILTLRVAVGLTAEQTAEAMGTTAGAIRVAQHRALARLRNQVGADAELADLLT